MYLLLPMAHSFKKLCMLSLAGLLFVACGQSNTNENTNDTSIPTQNIVLTGSVLPETLRISSPSIGEMVESPVVITGEARGWFFEGSFPITIVDENGATLTQGFASSLDDWMTDAFVPFKAELSFAPGNAKSGAIIFSQNNPADMEGSEVLQYELPVSFQPQVGEKITLYFNNSKIDPTTLSCETVYPVERAFLSSQDKAKDALSALLAGPNENEVANGYFSSISKEAVLRTISIQNGVMVLDFNEKLNTGGSCQSQSIRAQIESTARALGLANSVMVTVNGSPDGVLEP